MFFWKLWSLWMAFSYCLYYNKQSHPLCGKENRILPNCIIISIIIIGDISSRPVLIRPCPQQWGWTDLPWSLLQQPLSHHLARFFCLLLSQTNLLWELVWSKFYEWEKHWNRCLIIGCYERQCVSKMFFFKITCNVYLFCTISCLSFHWNHSVFTAFVGFADPRVPFNIHLSWNSFIEHIPELKIFLSVLWNIFNQITQKMKAHLSAHVCSINTNQGLLSRHCLRVSPWTCCSKSLSCTALSSPSL